ncbi:Kazal-type serine protease inhibitor domain-containing protein [Oricola sp.]|uniref:Kazal-type serine protease inhibitor domain-containing protein n=1 Tax=Oricola sp. TaxID=1979950 RepID=UPI0025E81D31|nr:Kazal-type serine protease inhibitor domain-containing protein [Oricola sp.]MCI5074334.1 protease inhibitor [Oricola sp.]
MTRIRHVLATAALAATFALAGCDATISPPPADAGLCPNVYQPVCARIENGQQRTYPNACSAVAEGYRAYSPGACDKLRSDRVCPQIHQPVCAQIGGRLATYTNDCVAGAEGARVVRQGAC